MNTIWQWFVTSHLGDTASVLALFISFATFLAASRAANLANRAINAITRTNALNDIVEAQNVVTEIQELHRSQRFGEALQRYLVIKRAIATVLASTLILQDDERSVLASLRDDLNDFQRTLERALNKEAKITVDVTRYNELLFEKQDALISITARYRQKLVE